MKKVIFWSALLLSSISFFSVAHGVTISMSLPGDSSPITSPGGFVNYFYQYALGIGGILAFGVVVYGGVQYMISAGNPSGQSEAKEWIKAALMGLLLLAGAYFILNVINPKLTNLTLPTLTPVSITATASTTQQVIQSAIASCTAACADASCTAACNTQGTSLQSAFSGACSANTCSSSQNCQNDGNGGHFCHDLVPSLPTISPSTIPPGDYTSPVPGKKCFRDLSNSQYYICQ